MIRNINEKFGDSVLFDDIEQMRDCINDLGYLPVDGLTEGRDYEIVHRCPCCKVINKLTVLLCEKCHSDNEIDEILK